MYVDNGAEYYDGGHFQRAYFSWDQALLIDKDNESAMLGQAMALYQMGREEKLEAIKPLTEATTRFDALRNKDFDRDQWKVELGVGLVHQRWCDLYDRKLRIATEQQKRGVPPDEAQLAIERSEFTRHLGIAENAFKNVLAGEEKDRHDRLTCWVGLAQSALWRDDLPTSLKYANLYLAEIVKSTKLWKDSATRYPKETPIWQAKLRGAEMQEADLRDLMGAVYFKMGRTEEAEKELDRIIEMFPQHAPAFLNRGVLRQMRGDDDHAKSDFRKFLSLTALPDSDPSILESTRRLAEVESRLAAQNARDMQEPPKR